MADLKDKIVVVTGASRGLGEAMALGFAEQGAHVVLAARNADDLARVEKSCMAAGAAGVAVVTTDVTDETQVKHLVDTVIEHGGRIDVFVANAGISYMLLTEERFTELPTYDIELARQIFDVNVFGLWRCMKYALPVMAAGSSFIAIGSETGRVLRPGSGAYALSKTTVDGMVAMAAKENAERGVRVNCLSPGGMVDTQLFGPDGMPDRLKQMFAPLPADIIVPAALHLATEDVTGMFLSGKEFNARGAEALVPVVASAAPQG